MQVCCCEALSFEDTDGKKNTVECTQSALLSPPRVVERIQVEAGITTVSCIDSNAALMCTGLFILLHPYIALFFFFPLCLTLAFILIPSTLDIIFLLPEEILIQTNGSHFFQSDTAHTIITSELFTYKARAGEKDASILNLREEYASELILSVLHSSGGKFNRARKKNKQMQPRTQSTSAAGIIQKLRAAS